MRDPLLRNNKKMIVEVAVVIASNPGAVNTEREDGWRRK